MSETGGTYTPQTWETPSYYAAYVEQRERASRLDADLAAARAEQVSADRLYAAVVAWGMDGIGRREVFDELLAAKNAYGELTQWRALAGSAQEGRASEQAM